MYKISQAVRLPLRVSYCILLLLFTSVAYAGAGHDHGAHEEEAMPMAPATPRLVMESSQFELVGVLEDKNFHLYLDSYSSNTPVFNARIELELEGKRWQAVAKADGSYHIPFKMKLEEGVYPVLATILTEQASDLLTGELAIHHDEVSQKAEEQGSKLGIENQPWVMAGVLPLLLLLGIVIRRDRQKQRTAA